MKSKTPKFPSKVVKLTRKQTLEVDVSHAKEALVAIYNCKSLEEAKDLAYIAADKMSDGEPEEFLGI